MNPAPLRGFQYHRATSIIEAPSAETPKNSGLNRMTVWLRDHEYSFRGRRAYGMFYRPSLPKRQMNYRNRVSSSELFCLEAGFSRLRGIRAIASMPADDLVGSSKYLDDRRPFAETTDASNCRQAQEPLGPN
jgi:hypothetical protein